MVHSIVPSSDKIMIFFNWQKLKTGFTLIEMLVAITILLLMVGGAMAGFSNFNDRRRVEETAKQVQQLLVSAQQKAAVKETPQDCLTASKPLQGYRVSYSSDKYTLSAVCDTNYPPTAGTATVVAVGKDVSAQSTFFTGLNTSQIDFYSLERGTSTTADVNYTFSASGISYQFSVNHGGTVTNVKKI
ncbi:MAG: hypothetical protein COU66_02040 [Candidatus Pacebacteria bacterium CG10_big_fil_rev_8_21_14_0_10_44_11]|nr:MAG: hypothetical protein COU66_02040 [Candidatus Pacebacteria bacterium CG10_big_fil_rev_8_21_14_0_10_44_11]